VDDATVAGREEAAVTRRYWSVVEATVGMEEAIVPAAEASMRMVRVEVAERPVGSVAT
jgi:hypothetical protein